MAHSRQPPPSHAIRRDLTSRQSGVEVTSLHNAILRPLTVSANHIGTQLHVGSRLLSPGRFPRVRHGEAGTGKPHGGMWTSTFIPGPPPSSAWTSTVRGNGEWWTLVPDPAARLLTLASLTDVAVLHNVYPGTDGTINYPRLARDGFAGVHASEHVVHLPESPLAGWACESTVWLRWAFIGAPAHIEAPQQVRTPHHYELTGRHTGLWFDAIPATPEVEYALRRGHLPGGAFHAAQVIIESVVVAHNFADETDVSLPIGPGLWDALYYLSRDLIPVILHRYSGTNGGA